MNRDSAVLLVMAVRHYGYYWFPEDMRGDAWNIAGALCIICGLLLLRPWWGLSAWAIGEEALVAACSIWWLLDPVSLTGDQCSARVGFKLASIGIVCLSFVTFRYAARVCRLQPIHKKRQ